MRGFAVSALSFFFMVGFPPLPVVPIFDVSAVSVVSSLSAVASVSAVSALSVLTAPSALFVVSRLLSAIGFAAFPNFSV